MRLLNVFVAGAIAAGSVAGIAQVSGSGSTGAVPKFTGSSTIGNSVITESNGSIGIGTTSPQTTLDVNGSIRSLGSSGFTFSSNADVWMKEGYGLNVGVGGNTPAFATRFYNTSGATLMSVRADGNVGIGTSSPAGLIDVGSSGNVGGFVVTGRNIDANNSNFDATFLANSSKLATAWNRTGGEGETDFLANRGGGNAGGFAFYDVTNSGAINQLLRVNGTGDTTVSRNLGVAGNVALTGGGAHMTYPDGTVQSTAWNGTTCGGDYAESIDVTGDRKAYEPGDVLVIDPKAEGKFLKSFEAYATTVMGIYSTQPGLTGRRVGAPKTGEEVPMAMLGIVPTKVSAENGPIKPGDLLVSSSTPGYAMKGTDHSRMMGALIGKALGHLDSGTGVIEVGIALQ